MSERADCNDLKKAQAYHNKLISQIEMAVDKLPLFDGTHKVALLRLIWKYGGSCYRLVEAEHAEGIVEGQ